MGIEFEFVDEFPFRGPGKGGWGKWTAFVSDLPVNRVAKVAIADPTQAAATEYYGIQQAAKRLSIPVTVMRRGAYVYVERLA